MDWTAGYASDIEYTAGFYREQSPVYLNFVCLLNGFEPVPLDRPYTYFELGCGRALTVNLVAASNPHGQFYAADFNPAHISGARQLADAAHLKNLVLLENSFADLAEGKVSDLPQFDFITLHGIYTWVNPENQRYIVDFIARYLKPGGIVYLSYNALPGWAAAEPLQRLLVEHADMHPNRSDVQFDQAKAFVERLSELQAAYFVQNATLGTRLQTLKTANKNYLVHEYMHRQWQPKYHVDVVRDLADAKLDYVGSAELPLAFPSLYLSQEKQDVLKDVPDAGLRETVKDYLLNTGFRKDVFVRGARPMGTVRHDDCLRRVGLALMVPRQQINLKMKLPFGEVSAKEELYGPILDALAIRPHSLPELAALPALKGQTLVSVKQIAAILIGAGNAAPYFLDQSTAAIASSQALNHALAADARYGDDYQAFASPLLGNGIAATFVERLTHLILHRPGQKLDASHIAQQIWSIMSEQGRRMMKDGVTLTSDQDNIDELVAVVETILKRKLVVWRQLKMI